MDDLVIEWDLWVELVPVWRCFLVVNHIFVKLIPECSKHAFEVSVLKLQLLLVAVLRVGGDSLLN